MGFEVIFKYHEEISKGEYNKEELKTKNVKVGSPYETVPLETVAGKVMAQLARRNILVVEVEIYEYSKKQISFKETDDGILIKNRKFSFEGGASVVTELEELSEVLDTSNVPVSSEELLLKLLSNPALAAVLKDKGIAPKTSIPAPVQSFKPIRYEIFGHGDPVLAKDAKRRGYAFTIGKRYPIISETKTPPPIEGMTYITIDDNGHRRTMNDRCFSPETQPLSHGFVDDTSRPKDNLDWSGHVNQADVPNLR